MATISSAGIGSGLDVNGIITQLMAIEKQPLSALDKKEAAQQARLSAYGTLKGAISSLQTAALSLKSSTLYSGMAATSSSATTLTASANTAASAGTYAIQVIAKAKGQSIASQTFSSITSKLIAPTSTDYGGVGGKIRIQLGTYDSSGNTFTPDATRSAVDITVTSATSSLSSIRDSINAADAGVRANLVYVGSAGYKLTLTSTTTGATNSMKLTVTDNVGAARTDNTELAKLSFDPTAGYAIADPLPHPAHTGANQFDIMTEAQDAHLKIDGLDVYRTSNVFSDAITGVTLNVAGDSGTSTLTVARNTSSISSAFDTFVKAYNDSAKLLAELTVYNSQTGQKGVLLGDSGARSLQSSLRKMIAGSRIEAGSSVSTLSDLGLAVQRDGSILFDSSKLASALSASPSTVQSLMSSTATASPGLAVSMSQTLDGIMSTGGSLAGHVEGINRGIADLAKQRDTLNTRLVQIEKRYRTQYSSLDTLVASMQKTSQYLTQQLASLSANTSK